MPRAGEIPIGAGCATGGLSPTLAGSARPVLGDSTYRLIARGFPPQSPAAFLLGAAASIIDLPGGCRTHVGLPLVVFTASVASDGTAVLALPVPAAPSLAGTDLYAQAIALSIGGTRLDVTGALHLRLGR